ncbi:MAG: ABC transporter permease [Nocardioidaceae bacterium]|nr:ABC transporter permease [Nocardioidaceae bacterium]
MSSLAGVRPLAWQAVRRDRLMLALWTLALVGVCYASAAATESLYPTTAEQVRAAEAINDSPAIVALYGPILDVHSLGELAMTKLTVLYAVILSVLFVILVRRHTRVEEESGRTELVGGTAVGRDAPLVAAVVEAAVVALGIGLLAGLADLGGGLPVAGSLAFGASWAGIGLVAVGVTAVACQLSASARTCAAIAAGAVGVLYLLRAVGDTSAAWVSWLSPFGWSTQLRAWSGPRWWVLVLYVVLAAVLVGVAHLLRQRRDLGSGLLAARPGPADGSPRLGDAVALAVRVHAPSLAVWSCAVAGLAVVFGAIAPGIGDLLDSDPAREMIERLGGVGVLEETLLAAILSILAVVFTCFALTVVGHGGSDEQDGRTEQVLATATSRSRTFAATLVVALGGSLWLLVVAGVGLALGYGQDFGALLGAALAQAPAVWLVAALAALAWAWRSAGTIAGWVLLGLFLTLGQLGELLGLPDWVLGLSPYTHVPAMPVEPFAPAPFTVLTLLTALVLTLAWTRYRTRDIG